MSLFISGIAGYAVSDNKNIITQYDKLAEIPVERLKTLVNFPVYIFLYLPVHTLHLYKKNVYMYTMS